MQSNFIIVGSGIAGLFLAEKLSEFGEVTLVTKGSLDQCNTSLAQGGIAAVRNFKDDSIQSHVDDTLNAGSYHNNKKAVEFLAENANEALKELESFGVVFDKMPTQEGAHSKARIWHKDDFSGEYIEESLILRVQKNVNINIWDRAYVFDLIVENQQCRGVKVFDHNEEVHFLEADYTILASGGAGFLYEKTTNPSVTVGDGIALAIRYNIELADLEFMQFHPTGLNMERQPMFLLSEALRGEGAKLVNVLGEEFMQNYHEMGDLAPRDIVSRAIYNEQKKGEVYLDMRHKSPEFIRQRFPNIAHELRKYDLKLERDLIPVTPAAHYTCGGIRTDLQGKTSLKNLLAVGEVACTGVHGANRLASNSLLEAVVFARNLYEGIVKSFNNLSSSDVALAEIRGSISKGEVKLNVEVGEMDSWVNPENDKKDKPENDMLIISDDYPKFLSEIKKIMWEYFGIVRSFDKMDEGREKLQNMKPKCRASENVQLTALAIAESCLERKGSLGCHFVE